MAAAAGALCTFLNISDFVFLVFASLVCSLSFNMPYYPGNIKLEGAANITDRGIQLTPFEGFKAGRAMYAEPLRLWDKASGNLADFATNFTFNINSNGNSNYGDGLAFFLADFSTPLGPVSQTTIYGGGGLGLTDGNLQKALDPFVAVVFDTYSSSQPQTSTVSINIRSMKTSVKSTPWPNDVPQGRPNSASITYSAVSKILQVVFTGYSYGQTSINTLSCEVDLRVVDLPEFVSVGFSAATGSFFEEHTVSSWQFGSTPPRPAGSLPPPPPNPLQKVKDKIKRDLMIGVFVGVPSAVAVFVFLYCLCKKRQPKNVITLGKVSAKAGAQAAKVAQDPTFECCANVAQVLVEPNPECCVKVEEAPTNQEPCAEVAEGEEDGVLETFISILDIFKTCG